MAGRWAVRRDEADAGLTNQWFARSLESTNTAALPGSLATSGLGHPYDPETGRYRGTRRPCLKWPSAGYTDETRVDELGALVPERFYYGPAWFERTVEIPAAWADRSLRLTLERVKWTSRLWVDGREITGAGADSLSTPHVYEIPPLKPGPHRFTLRLDNRPALNLGLAGHGYGMETETLWNGVAGALTLEPLAPLRFANVRLQPALDGTIRIEAAIQGPPAARPVIRARFRGTDTEGRALEAAQDSSPLRLVASGADAAVATTTFTLRLPAPPAPWDEFHPALHRLELSLRDAEGWSGETHAWRIGFRELVPDGRQLRLNGVPLFLRGTLDCAIHPVSDTPPTDRAWWQRTLGTFKRAGFNHVRFHTWCPPEAAFDVADELGLYFEVETVYWVDDWVHGTAPHPPCLGEDPDVDAWVLAEAKRILRAYGHHPSLMLFCIGNEFGMKGTDWDAVDRIVAALRETTDTALVTGCTARKSLRHDQYWVTHRTKAATRGIGPAHTDWDFAKAVVAGDKPVIAHETGQRQSWPDYDALLAAFDPRGVIQPHNLERLRARAEARGITNHHARCAASVALAHRLYRAEQEALRRTPGMGGYQLLMLHDFTGQGEALVGLLDPFYREKPGISLDAIRAWNGPTVPLARFRSCLWTTDQTFAATLELAHQGPGALGPTRPRWTLRDLTHDRVIASGKLPPFTAPAGSLSALGEVEVPLAEVTAPARLDFTVRVGAHTNAWPLWVYPPAQTDAANAAPPKLRTVHRLDRETLDALDRGETVLLWFHRAAGERFRRTSWAGTYWTAAWGWGRGLGLMCDPAHPALAGFPNQGHTDWQWRELAEGATCVRLDPAHAAGVVVEQISAFHRPVHEAFLFEARVGRGRLLACGFDLERGLAQRPAARAFRESLLAYATGGTCRSPLQLAREQAVALFDIALPLDATVRADSECAGHEARRAIDGAPNTCWHTRWQGGAPPHPHELDIELRRPQTLRGIRLLQRRDQENGRLAEFSLHLAGRKDDWGAPVLDHARLENHTRWQTFEFAPRRARFLRLVTHRAIKNQPFAALAELRLVEAE